jgi:hypothetical protein
VRVLERVLDGAHTGWTLWRMRSARWCCLVHSRMVHGGGRRRSVGLRERMKGRVWWSLNAELRRTLVEWVFLEMKDDGSELREG